jgi:hypothetical protein
MSRVVPFPKVICEGGPKGRYVAPVTIGVAP